MIEVGLGDGWRIIFLDENVLYVILCIFIEFMEIFLIIVLLEMMLINFNDKRSFVFYVEVIEKIVGKIDKGSYVLVIELIIIGRNLIVLILSIVIIKDIFGFV